MLLNTGRFFSITYASSAHQKRYAHSILAKPSDSFPLRFPILLQKKNKQKTHKLAAICKYLINTVGEGSKNNYLRLYFATPQLSSLVAEMNDKPL